MNQVKVWIRQKDLTKVSQGQSPIQYWTTEPLKESARVEMFISIDQLNQWSRATRENSSNVSGL